RVQLAPPPAPPGAIRSTIAAMLEKDEIVSCLVDDATVTAVEMQPGEVTELVELLLPAAMAVATPAALRLSIGPFSGLLSHAVVEVPPPMLMLMEASVPPGGLRAFWKIQFKPDSMSLSKAPMQGGGPPQSKKLLK